MKRTRLLIYLAVALCHGKACPAEQLTAEQVESIQAQLEQLEQGADNRFATRRSNAGGIFLDAAETPRKALALYFDCHKQVNYEQEGRSESDFRVWRESQEKLKGNDQFLEGLQIQLTYLAISCKVAEAQSLDQSFPRLLSYVDSLSNLREMPGTPVLQGIGGSIFVEAFKLQELLDENTEWEDTPFDISGIYDKTILPYLRLENPGELMSAWDRRIQQQGKVAEFIDKAQRREAAGDRDKQRKAEDRQEKFEKSRTGALVKAYDEDDYLRDTLPNLKWGKMKDYYTYINQVDGAKAMLLFLNENAASEHLKPWVVEMQSLIGNVEPKNEEVSLPVPPETTN